MTFLSLEFEDNDPLFCLSFHPSKPQFVLGFASGRVICYEYLSKFEDSVDLVEKWSTKRHKGSCRAISYDLEGKSVISCSSDGVIKKCNSATGKVSDKTRIKNGVQTICVNEEYIVVGDESGSVHCMKHNLEHHREYRLPGMDSVSTICPLTAVNKHNFAVSADMHVFRIDVRKDEPISQSEDQEDEILCGCVASEQLSAWGMSEGVVTVWKNKGLGDQQQRIKLTKEGSVDSLLAAEEDNHVIAGTSDGWVAELDLISAKVLHKSHHNPAKPDEDVMYLDYDFEYKLVSASMSLLNVWGVDELSSKSVEDNKEKGSKRLSDGPKKKSKKGKKNKINETPVPNAFADLMG